MMGLGLGMGVFGFLWMLLFWAGLILLAIWLVGLLFPAAKTHDQAEPGTALEILKRRYANGELTTEQYQQMLQTLHQ
jgi:putative membrane protein